MRSNWRTVDLNSIAQEVIVGFVGSMSQEYIEKGVPFFRSKNISEYNILWDDIKYISLDFHEKIKKSKLFSGDVVIVRTGKPGTTCVIPDDIKEANCSDLVIVRLKKDIINPYYFSYFMNSAANHQVNSYLVGAVQQHFNIGSAKKIQVLLPSKAEQDAIVSILKALDDKVNLNQQINKTLEAMAQALFQSWFVDFDPVKAKIAAKAKGQDPEWAAMGIISGKDAVELKVLQNDQPEAFRELQATAALFPDALVESELGDIPEGWKVGSIGNETDLFGGGTPSTSNLEYWKNGDIHWSSPKDLSGKKDKILLDTERKITQVGLKSITSELLPVNTVLLSSRAPIGYLALTKIPVAINQGYIALKCIKNLSPEFVLQWIYVNLNEIKQLGSGTTFPELSKKSFRQFPILVPQSSIVKAYTKIVSPYYSQMVELIKQSQTNSNLRDLLLPSLLSGELPLCEMDFQG